MPQIKWYKYRFLSCLMIVLLLNGCRNVHVKDTPALFRLMKSSETKIYFRNDVPETENINPLQYENSYNGGGVAIGDLNNDGLDDIYFSGNKLDNKLYLNKGNWEFEDITDIANVKGRDSWKTGITMADANGDNLLDIYVCHSGDLPGSLRANELFINKGNNASGTPVFEEEAEKYGIADSAFSNQAAFFDYDRDGDLDMILLNHSPRRFNNLDESYITYLIHQPDSLTGIKLYRNEEGRFKDITRKSGINNARLNYNLGVSVADVNNDGWADIYISNDYLSPDYLYINNRDGTFTDRIKTMLAATSQFSMGNDVADINNDGWADIYTLDMLPEDNHRQKMLFANDNYELFELREKTGLNAQYMRNMLHMNNGDGSFSEIAQLAGVSNTDWSWAPLFADFDNDGWKDLYVTNGYLRDYTNLDFLKFMGDKLRNMQGNITKTTLLELVKKMPPSNIRNYLFQNQQGVNFSDKSIAWGFKEISNSNGAAYADLDNDGDLDLVVNNINDAAFVYKNEANEQLHNNFLKVKLRGDGANTQGVGTVVKIFSSGQQQMQQQLISKGFQSSVSPVLVFGLGKSTVIDSLQINWVSGKRQQFHNVAVNSLLEVDEKQPGTLSNEKPHYTDNIFEQVNSPLSFSHMENMVNDFKRQPLLINSLSYNGPCIAKGDINGDGLEDIFIGGATGQVSAVYLQSNNKNFTLLPQAAFPADSMCEDAGAVFFDADKDGDIDLFVASGGYDQFTIGDKSLESRLYLNNGKGIFRKAKEWLPFMQTAASCVAAADINKDGWTDLFIGGRAVPGRYPEAAESYVLLNTGKGGFVNATNTVAPAISKAGMFADAVFCDMNQDGSPDLVTAGEWMPVQVWINVNGKLADQTATYLGTKYSGWWNKLVVDDINGDKKPDLIAGNCGRNMQCRVSDKEPGELFYKDFDNNGSIDPVFCFYLQGKSYPYISRDELLDQMSVMRTRFPDYKSYADADIKTIFTKTELAGAGHLTVNTMESVCFISTPGTQYIINNLPQEAQYAPLFAMCLTDVDHDGIKDLLSGGGVTFTRVKFGLNHANHGMLFKGKGDGSFMYVPQLQSGLSVTGDIRFIKAVNSQSILFGRNNNTVIAYKLKK